MSQASETSRAEVLLDALPFIQRFRGQTFVIKYGGSAMEDEHLVERTLLDIVFLEAVGIRAVVVHGGGKAITDRMRTAGIKARFVNGLRVTDAPSMKIVADTLENVINPMIAGKLGELGGQAAGVSGREVIRARRAAPVAGKKGQTADLGFVGEVEAVTLGPVRDALGRGAIPVVSPVGVDEAGTALNINADVAAGAIAADLAAAKLIYISDVRGIMRDPSQVDSLIPSVNRETVGKLIKDGIIEGGMIPKVESASEALGKGVGKVHLIDGRLAHALLLEVFTDSGVGTEIIP